MKSELNSLQQRIIDCKLCFRTSKDKIVTYPQGSDKPKIFIVGESPGLSPNLPKIRTTLFHSKSARILRKALQNIDISSKDCYFTNTVKCAYQNRSGLYTNCIEIYLVEEFMNLIHQEMVVLVLGYFARRIIDGHTEFDDYTKVYNVLHPATVLYGYISEGKYLNLRVWGEIKNKLNRSV